MGARVVLRLTQYTMNRKSLQTFLDQCEENGLGPHGKIVYAVDSEGKPCLVAELPERASDALEKRQTPKGPTKAQEAVREQLQGRREAVESGAPVPGHVPAVAKGGRVLKSRKKK